MNVTTSCKMVLNNYRRKDGQAIVLMQVIINRKKKALKTGISIQPYLFNKNTGEIKAGGNVDKKRANDLNLILRNELAKASEIFVRARLSNITLNTKSFKLLFEAEQDYSQTDFISFMNDEINRLNGSREQSSIKSYLKTYNKLITFKPAIFFDVLKIDLIEDFERFLIKSKLAPNTRSLHHKNFKAFINIAIKRDIKIKNPYDDFKIKRIKGSRNFLTPEEVKRLIELYQSGDLNPELQNVLEYFLFACFTGLRISDIQVLKSEDIISNILVFTPVKTKNIRKVVKIPLPEFAIKLIHGRVGKLFNTISDQKTNANLKQIAEFAQIKKTVSFHVARHTFATSFLRNGGKLEVLKELLGHTKIETTMEYTHILEESLIEQMALFNY